MAEDLEEIKEKMRRITRKILVARNLQMTDEEFESKVHDASIDVLNIKSIGHVELDNDSNEAKEEIRKFQELVMENKDYFEVQTPHDISKVVDFLRTIAAKNRLLGKPELDFNKLKQTYRRLAEYRRQNSVNMYFNGEI